MQYAHVKEARFVSRPNRFVARVELDGGAETVHVKNTGRCRELLLPGSRVWLSRGDNPGRKTAWDLVAVEKETPRGPLLINLDSQAPNAVFGEYARAGLFLPGTETVRAEVREGDSRLDFAITAAGTRHLIEVKGVTLEEDGHCLFPDAPTLRGAKHLRELARLAREGVCAHLVFVVQMAGMRDVAPNAAADPAFARALWEAREAGVRLHALSCAVTPDSLSIAGALPILVPFPGESS